MKYSKRLGSVALASLLALGFVGCNKDDSNGDAVAETTITPYERILKIPGSTANINDIAVKISDYVVNTNEADVLGLPSNWVIAGANEGGGEVYDGLADLLPIPAWNGDTKYKSRVIEFCNKAYATQATNTGQQRGSALPCEVSVHSDGEYVYVDMLDATAIFSIFFPGIEDADGTLKAMAAAVKSELRTMVKASLVDQNITELTDSLGPKFTSSEIASIKDTDIYAVTNYKSTNGATFTSADASTLSKAIIAKLGTETSTADTNVAGLSEGSAWRSGREAPIAIPGVQVAEACSPKYAALATKLGSEYITALPCEITAYLDKTDSTNKTLSISILDPNFMFNTMFKGAVTNAIANGILTTEGAAVYNTLAATVLADLKKIVDAAIADSGLNLVAYEKEAVTTPVVTTPVTTTPATDLSMFDYIIIYNNIDSTMASSMQSAYTSFANYKATSITAATSCSNFGFTGTASTSTTAGYSVSTYMNSDYSKYCVETDYAGVAGIGGSSNVLFSYNIQ